MFDKLATSKSSFFDFFPFAYRVDEESLSPSRRSVPLAFFAFVFGGKILSMSCPLSFSSSPLSPSPLFLKQYGFFLQDSCFSHSTSSGPLVFFTNVDEGPFPEFW